MSRRWRRALAYGVTFVAGGIGWETVRLATMNRSDRIELVDQMLDAKQRMRRGIVDPLEHVHLKRTLSDILHEKADLEYARCGGSAPVAWSREEMAPMIDAEIIARDYERGREDERRSDMAVRNSVFLLRSVAICRRFGGCGPALPTSIKGAWPETLARYARQERITEWPQTFTSAEPFVLSLACGMGLRTKQRLPVLPNAANRAAAERACERGYRTACP